MGKDWNGFKIALTAILLGAALPAPAQIAAGSTKFIPTFLVYYSGGPALVAADAPQLAKFDLIDIDRFRYDNIGPNTWTAIKSINPGVQIYLYEVGPETPNHLDTTPELYLNGLGRYDVSRGHFMGSLNGNHPELYLLDASGKRIYSTAYSNAGANRYWHLMDFGAAAYQSYWLTAVKADIVDQPWVADGVFVEDCMAHANAGGFSGIPSMYPSNAAWSGAMNSFVEAITGALRGYGQKLWCNRGESGTADGSSAWLALDGGANPPEVLLEEGAFAVKSGASSVQFHQESTWKRQVDTIGAIKNSRVAILSQANLEEGQAGTDSLGNPVTYGQALWYSLGSFLLSKNDDLGNAYFMFSGASGYDRIRWHAEYDSIDLGRAVGAYRVKSVGTVNVYWREFERGYVYVNPTPNDVALVNLPRASRQLTRDNLTTLPDSIPSVSEISLNGHHAAILMKASTDPISDTTAPSVPTGLVGSAVSPSQINLSWNASTDNVGVTGYYVYLNNVALAATSATSFQHTGLTAGTTYNYRVSAFDAVPNHSAWTATPVAVTTPPPSDTEAPSVPTGLVGTAVSSSQTNLSWNPSTDNVGVTGYVVYLNNVKIGTSTTTSFTHSGLTAGTTSNYRVSAYDAVPNHSAWTAATVAVTTTPQADTEAPSVPTGLVGTAVSSSQIKLSWNPSTDNVGVTGYVVYLNNVKIGTSTTTSFTHSGLTAGTTSNYRVSAFDAVPNHSAWTAAPVAVTTPALPDTTAPSVPTGLTGTAVSSSQINLSWNPSTDNVGVTGYVVYLNNVRFADTTATSFTHTGLTAGATYNYRVSAFDAVPNHSAWTAAPVAVTTPALPDTTAPSVPTGLTGTAVSSSQINLSWNPSTDNVGVTGYVVYLNNVRFADTTATSFAHTGLTAGATYNYRVSAFDAVPNHSAWTATPVAVTTAPLPDTQAPSIPANLVATGVSASQVNLSWSAATDNVGVTGYRVYRDGTLVASPASTSASITGLAASTTYAFTVSALDAVGNASAQSAPLAVTTLAPPIAPPGPSPYSGTPIAIPGTFEAENFDLGGEGVAYHDNVTGNAGGQYRLSEHVDIIVSSDSLGGGYVVNNFETGEWLVYTINVAASASYDIEIRTSTTYSTSAFHVEIDGVNVTGNITVPNTGSWNTFQWVGKKGIALTAGQHVLKIAADQQYFNLNSVRVVTTPSNPPSVDPGTVSFFCTFANSPTDCGFEEQALVAGRASIVNFGRDGGTAVRLHTEPGDNNVAGSGAMERNDIWLSQAETDGYEGREHWWSHSVLFPDDFAMPSWQMYVIADFHNIPNTSGQANFHINFENGVLIFRGYGGATQSGGQYKATIGPVTKNVWYDFVYHVKWSSGSDGFFDAWVNGVKKLSHRGPTIYTGQGVYLKLANYHSPIAPTGSLGPASSVIHDRVIRGTTPLAVSLGPLEGVLALVNGVLTPLQ